MKKLFIVLISTLLSNISFAQTADDLKMTDVYRKFIVGSTNLIDLYMLTENVAFSAYLNQDTLHCKMEVHVTPTKPDASDEFQNHEKMYLVSKDIVYYRIIIPMNNCYILQYMNEFDSGISSIVFKVSYIAKDYYKNDYDFNVSTEDLFKIKNDINEEAFFNILKDIK